MQNLSKLLGLLKFTRQKCNLENRLVYYITSIEPNISFALIFYGGTNSNNLHTIFLLQKKLLGVVFGKPLFDHSSGLFERSSIQTVHELHASALFMFSLENFCSFTYSTTQKSTRSSSLFLVRQKFFNKQVKKFSVEHRAIKRISNLKTRGAWSDDIVTSDRSAKNQTFPCLINNFVIRNANITDFFK